ncbi:hypothetical protein MPP7335_01176 [Mycolicibacterium parafortuitum]|uniref:Uncharacterized protein n=1 Tax=Mycolicibacterium parafortuitum TaxID=39692 RepID=A0A375YED8_MYCPF|nr:hypothetical protein MPP7335_01176 [Mycolicibacterium parafortuitum]
MTDVISLWRTDIDPLYTSVRACVITTVLIAILLTFVVASW